MPSIILTFSFKSLIIKRFRLNPKPRLSLRPGMISFRAPLSHFTRGS